MSSAGKEMLKLCIDQQFRRAKGNLLLRHIKQSNKDPLSYEKESAK
jgi:hypothetical protein